MIEQKSDREIQFIRQAGAIVAVAHRTVREKIKPGVSTYYLNKICEKVITQSGALPSFKGLYGFPTSCCISVNEISQHGIPSKKTILKEGDILTIDIGASIKGYHADSAWSYGVGKISDEATKLLQITEEALMRGLSCVRPNNYINDISKAIGNHLIIHNYSTPHEFTGHGIGRNVHEDPSIPNYDMGSLGPLLKVGMVLAIEPIAHLGLSQVVIMEDGWSARTIDFKIAAHFEHTVVVTETGFEVLTKQ